jgi:transposase-like protein
MLRKLRRAMGDRDRLYRLQDHTLQLDDAFIGGKRPGKRGRGAHGKTTVLVTCEVNHGKPRFAVMETLPALTHETVRDFARRRLTPGQEIHTDAFAALGSLIEVHHQVAKNTPPALVKEWLPWVHILIANLKRFILGTYHSVSQRYMQEYLDEFLYRFNRRFWEQQIPNRLLRLCIEHAPIRLQSSLT